MAGWSLRGLLAALLIFSSSSLAARSGAAAEETLARSLEVLADQGLKGTSDGLQAAEGAYQRAKRLAPGDGRVDYAWSLVLTKNRKFEEAETAFQKALGAPQLCLEARISQVRSLLKARKFAEATESLIEMAELAGDPQLAHLTAAERSAAAAWIGQAVAFLTGPLGDSDAASTLARREQALVTYLGELRPDFERGKQDFSVEHRKLQEQLTLALDDAEDQKIDAIRTNRDKQDKLDTAFKSASTEGAKVQETAKERLADIDSKLGSLETRYKIILATEARLLDSIVQLNINLAAYQRDLDRIIRQQQSGGRPVPETQGYYTQKILETQVEIELMQTDLAMAQAEKDRLQKQGNAGIRARMTALSDQQQADLQKSKAAAQYQKIQRSLQDENRKLNGSSGKAGRAQALRTKIQSWSTYDKTTPQSEFALMLGDK